MRPPFLIASLVILLASPAWAQLGPAGVPGAPGLAPETPEQTVPQATPAPQTAPAKHAKPTAKAPSTCAKTKNAKRCTERQKVRHKAQAACKGKTKDAFTQCVNAYVAQHGKQRESQPR